MQASQGPPPGAAELKQLHDKLQEPDWREQFASDPEQALADAGISSSNIPGEVLAALTSLSKYELEMVADMGATLSGAGYAVEVPGIGIFWYL
jgi:hypothetical protein